MWGYDSSVSKHSGDENIQHVSADNHTFPHVLPGVSGLCQAAHRLRTTRGPPRGVCVARKHSRV